MKRITMIIALGVLTSCSSTRFVDSWRNKEIATFKPEKLLVLGMTDNLTARKIFEEELTRAIVQRNINAFESGAVMDPSFTESQKNEEEINEMITELSTEGFDAIIITAVKGVDERRNYAPGYYTRDYRWVRFRGYYFRYQDVFYTPDYHSDYTVYHIETSIYNIDKDDARSLVWVGSFDIVNPQNITSTVNDYVARIIQQLERERLIDKI